MVANQIDQNIGARNDHWDIFSHASALAAGYPCVPIGLPSEFVLLGARFTCSVNQIMEYGIFVQFDGSFEPLEKPFRDFTIRVKPQMAFIEKSCLQRAPACYVSGEEIFCEVINADLEERRIRMKELPRKEG